MPNETPTQEDTREVDTSKPTVIRCTCTYDHNKKQYEVSLSAKQDGLTIESLDHVLHYDFMSAKIYIDNFFAKYKDATHDSQR